MISLAGRDIAHSAGKFALTGLGLGLLIGVTLTMAGVYRGMVDDAHALLNNSNADLWVVQKDTQGPYAEASSIKEDAVRSVRGMPGVSRASNVTYFTMQVQAPSGTDVRAMVVGIEEGQPGEPGYLLAGRQITRAHYEAVADIKSGFALGDRIQIRRHTFTVVGITQRMVSSGGDPMVFVGIKDAGSVRISVCEAVSEIGCWVNFILIQAPARPPEAPRLSPVSRVPPLSFCTPIGGLCESVFVQYCKLVHR